MRTSRLCSLWPDMRSLRFRRVPFGRDGAFDPGGATASRIAMPHILPSTVPSVSASATLFLSWLNPPPHPITVYASHPPSPTTAQHSLPGGALPPYRGRSFTGRNASASPDAPELNFRIHSPLAERCYGAGGEDGNFVAYINRWSAAMPQPNDLSRSLAPLDQDSTIIVVVELSQSSWLVGGVLPGIERQPRKKLEPSPERLLALLHRWRDESVGAGGTIARIVVAFEAGRDGFWLARWLEARGIEAHVIHPSSVAVSREHRRAKTDRLDTELLKRGFLGWLRGERGHCSMVRVPTIAEEDAKRPNRERECLVKERTRLVNRMKGTLARLGIRNFKLTLRQAAEHLAALYTPEGSALPPNVTAELERDIARLRLVIGQIKQLEEARRQRLEEQPERGPHAMVRLLARVVGIGIETADMLVNEVLSRPLRDRRAVARYAGLTGAPDESGAKRREQGLAKAGNARVAGWSNSPGAFCGFKRTAH